MMNHRRTDELVAFADQMAMAAGTSTDEMLSSLRSVINASGHRLACILRKTENTDTLHIIADLLGEPVVSARPETLVQKMRGMGVFRSIYSEEAIIEQALHQGFWATMRDLGIRNEAEWAHLMNKYEAARIELDKKNRFWRGETL